jgi:mannosyltransferase
VLSAAKSFPAGVARAADTPRPRLIAQATFIVVIAVALRAYDLGLQSLWTDELFSRYYGDLFGLKFLWTTGLLHEDSPPLYYMALEGWMHLFGAGEAAIRSLSLVASVLTLPLVYLIGRELSDARRGLLAMLIFALSPMQVGFAQEARTYALLLIPIGMVLLAVARLLRRDLRYRVLCLYGTGAITALYCHATAVIFIAACNIVVIGAILSDRQFNRSVALTRWIIVNALVGLAAVPELVAIVVMGRGGIGIEWIPPFRPVHLIRALSPVIVGTSTPDRFPGAELSLLLLACLAGATLAARPMRRFSLVLVAIPVAFVVLIAALSLYHPIFIARVFCWLGIPLAVLIAHALAAPSTLRPALAAVAIVTCAAGLGYQFAAPQKEPWREVLGQLGPELAHADRIVLAPSTDPTPFAYYAPYLTHLQIWDTGPHAGVEHGELPLRMGIPSLPREQLISDIRSGADVWLVLRTPDLPQVDDLLAEVPPPGRRIERLCGNVVCIAALSWPGLARP